jgi:superfamily I DNA and/or RNA helicase/very-short-patch-repair endonuclease
MILTKKLLTELSNRLKIGNRKGIHLNAIPGNSIYKLDLKRLSHAEKNLPNHFIEALLSENPLNFKVSLHHDAGDNKNLEEEIQLIKIRKIFESLINQTESIESEKGMNTFGFGFPILISKNKTDNKLIIAPLLIWQLKIKRITDKLDTWQISRSEEDPIQINEVLFNHLQNDAKVSMQIPLEINESIENGVIKAEQIIDLCQYLNNTINTKQQNYNKQEIYNIGTIKDKAHYEKLSQNNTSWLESAGIFSIFEVQKQNIIEEYDKLIEQIAEINLTNQESDTHLFQSISSVDTDPSQQSILHALESNKNILIQGPPGTGKSQTLTAILINALENRKKTIVVCEKRTALEVLQNALIERNLNHLSVLIKDAEKDRKLVVDSVRDRIDNHQITAVNYHSSKEELENILEKAKKHIHSINKGHLKLNAPIIDNKNWSGLVGKYLKENKEQEETWRDLQFEGIDFQYNNQEFKYLLDMLEKGESLYQSYKNIEPYNFINARKLTAENPYTIRENITQDFSQYIKAIADIKVLLKNIKEEYANQRKTILRTETQKIHEIIQEIENIQQIDHINLSLDKQINSLSYKISALFSKAKKRNRKYYNTLLDHFWHLENLLKDTQEIEPLTFKGNLEQKNRQVKFLVSKIKEITINFDTQLQTDFYHVNLFKTKEQLSNAETLQEKTNNLHKKITQDAWTIENINFTNLHEFIQSVEYIIRKKIDFFNAEQDLFNITFNWVNFYHNLSKEDKTIVNSLKTTKNWQKTFCIFYTNTVLAKSANQDLPTNDNAHQELEKVLVHLESAQLKFIKQVWENKQKQAIKAFEETNTKLTISNLYSKRSSKNNKRLSLRQIVKKDIDLFTSFFPIILTSPDVASNIFKGTDKYFDIILFDEASQSRLEENLPAILKANQIIISGDEHQMPPSNYFAKIFDGAEDEESEEEEEVVIDKDNILLGCESLLDFAAELNFEKKDLDFHYRSKHPFLIDFSNHAFYKQRLKAIPNTQDYVPIKYIQVDGTFYESTNEREADAVLYIIEHDIKRLQNGEYPSVGIATFNIHQRNLIKSKILERQKSADYVAFNEKIQELEQKGMFIKNLENIQGDERDIIILSTTYGIGKDGKFAQRFGPINSKKGYKLLNVIITRAKIKIYCCSSIPEQYFMNYKDYLATDKSNGKAYFYAYLAYCKAISEKNYHVSNAVLSALSENEESQENRDGLESPFEEEVYEILASHFGEEKLITQFKCAGFKIDIVYDTKLPNVPKIAIECDGAKEDHSSREAYLYDRHRQKILEQQGFVFHRIWSTNWWQNTSRETKKLVDFIKQTETNKTNGQM